MWSILLSIGFAVNFIQIEDRVKILQVEVWHQALLQW